MTEKTNKHDFKHRLLERNTLLVSFFGVYPAIAFANSAADGALLGAYVLILSVAVFMFASLTRKVLKGALSAIGCAIFSAAITSFAIYLTVKFGSVSLDGFREILPFAGVNAAVVFCAFDSGRTEAPAAFSASLANGYGYGFAVLIFGFVRELLASGSVFGFDIFTPVEFFSTTFGALLILACIAAAYRFLLNKANEYEDDVPEEGNENE